MEKRRGRLELLVAGIEQWGGAVRMLEVANLRAPHAASC